ncbi:MAG: hypothetical protein NWE83_13445 [Candidatus Bathyarchaeota archaeon]|nr:hypothetical protein [Candidatus Bathyarchaeota archaeon]
MLILALVAAWLTMIDVAETTGSVIQIDHTLNYIVYASAVIVFIRIILTLLSRHEHV